MPPLTVASLQTITHSTPLTRPMPAIMPALGAASYIEHMRLDKKAEAGQINFVLIDAPGKVVVRSAPDDLVARVIDASCED